MIVWVIPDLDLGKLSMWLVGFNGAPFVSCATTGINEYLIERDQVNIIVEPADGYEVSVLLLLDWQVRI